MAAAYEGHSSLVSFLLDQGAALNVQNNDGETALNLAAIGGHLRVVLLLATRKGVNLDVRNSEGWSALMDATSEGHLAVVEALLAKGADANITVSQCTGA